VASAMTSRAARRFQSRGTISRSPTEALLATAFLVKDNRSGNTYPACALGASLYAAPSRGSEKIRTRLGWRSLRCLFRLHFDPRAPQREPRRTSRSRRVSSFGPIHEARRLVRSPPARSSSRGGSRAIGWTARDDEASTLMRGIVRAYVNKKGPPLSINREPPPAPVGDRRPNGHRSDERPRLWSNGGGGTSVTQRRGHRARDPSHPWRATRTRTMERRGAELERPAHAGELSAVRMNGRFASPLLRRRSRASFVATLRVVK
jgi:hypothetical protein